MATIEEYKDALLQANKDNNIQAAELLASKINEQQTPTAYVNPDKAGIEKIPYVGPILRPLAQPFYEAAATANIALVEGPGFIADVIGNLYGSVDVYTNDKINAKYNKQYKDDLNQLATSVNKLKAEGREVDDRYYDAILKLDELQGSGISFADASKRAGDWSEAFVQENLKDGILNKDFTNKVIDTLVEDSDTNKKVKNIIEDGLEKYKQSEYAPSANTLMNETFIGNTLKFFNAAVMEPAKFVLDAAGVPPDTSEAIVSAVTLRAGPLIGKGNKWAKDKTGYSSLVKKVYGTTDKVKTERIITKKQSEIDKLRGEGAGLFTENYNVVKKLESELKLIKESANQVQYDLLGNVKGYKKEYSKLFEMSDMDLFDNFSSGKLINFKTNYLQDMKKALTNTPEGLDGFKRFTQWSAKDAFKAGRTAQMNVIEGMQNLFGKTNGFGPKRSMSEKTINEYNQVIDVMEGTLPGSLRTKFTENQKTLETVINRFQKEQVQAVKYLQKRGLLKDFDINEKFFPRRLSLEKPGIMKNFFGDPFKIKYGDLAPREKSITADRIYYKAVDQATGRKVFFTVAEAVNPKQANKSNLPGQPIIAVNSSTAIGGGRFNKKQEAPGDSNSPNSLLAGELTLAAKNLNNGEGVRRAGDVIPAPTGPISKSLRLGDLKVEQVSRKEFSEVFKRELTTDPLLAMLDSLSEMRQMIRLDQYQRQLLKTSFGQRNIADITRAAERMAVQNQKMYDPKFPNKNIATTNKEFINNASRDVGVNQLSDLKLDVMEAGLTRFSGKKFSRRVASIIEDNFRPFEKSYLGRVSDALVKNMMLNPIPHMHNELIHFYSTKGFFGSLNPKKTKWAEDYKWAYEQVLNRTPEFVKLIEGGASSMSVNVMNTTAWGKIMQQGTDTFWKSNENTLGKSKKAYSAMHKASKGYANISEFAQYSMWTMRDVLYMQLVKQKMRGKNADGSPVTMQQAAKLVELHMPTYRLPETVGPESLLGYKITRNISKALQNPDWVIFARYKHGMVSSGLNTAKDILSGLDPILSRTGKAGSLVQQTLGYKDIALGRSKSKQFADGIDSGLALGTAMYMLYPMMDALYEELFDGDEVKIRRAGILHVLETAHDVTTQNKDLQSLRQVLLTINPALMFAYEVMMNETIYNGLPVYDFNDVTGSGNIEDFGKDLGTKVLQTIPQLSNILNAQDDYEEFDLDKALGRQFDAKIKTPNQTRKAAERKARLTVKNLNEAIDEGKDLGPYLEEYWKTEPYFAD